jgi:low temperature requirement protein LtrA
MVAGIIAAAAADELLVKTPGATVHGDVSWLILSGTGLFLLGHAAFKATVWRVFPWARLLGVAVLACFGLLAGHVTELALASLTAAVAIAVAASDRLLYPPAPAADLSMGQVGAD